MFWTRGELGVATRSLTATPQGGRLLKRSFGDTSAEENFCGHVLLSFVGLLGLCPCRVGDIRAAFTQVRLLLLLSEIKFMKISKRPAAKTKQTYANIFTF